MIMLSFAIIQEIVYKIPKLSHPFQKHSIYSQIVFDSEGGVTFFA